MNRGVWSQRLFTGMCCLSVVLYFPSLTVLAVPKGTCDIDRDNDVDRRDIEAIVAARSTTADIDDPRDVDRDGMITVNDARFCTRWCTKPKCAETMTEAPQRPLVSGLARSGLEKARSGDHLGAVEDYNRAIQQDARDDYAVAFRSQSLRALGNDMGAQADIQRVLLLRLENWNRLLTENPHDPEVYAGRAFTRLSLGDAPGAIHDYARSLQLRPGHAPTLFALGNARYRVDDKTGAREAYDQALAVNPNMVESYVARAVVRLDLGDASGAESDRLTATRIAPTDQVTSRRVIE